MKCLICNSSFGINELVEFIYLHNICNKCMNLFIYSYKNVRISGVEISVYYLKFYQSIYEDNYLIYFQKFNSYVKNSCLRNKEILTIKDIMNDKNSYRKVIYILFHRMEYRQLSLVIEKVTKIKKIKRICFYEIL